MTAPPPRLRSSVKQLAKTAYAEAILSAAERLFLRDGYHATHMAAVAAEAGISVGTLYKHFPSKEVVFESLLDRGRQEGLALVRRCLELEDPRERLRSILREVFGHVESQNALLAILAELGPAGMPQLPSCREGDDRAVAEITEMVQATFEEGVQSGFVRSDVPTRLLAATLVGAMRATLLSWIREERSYSLTAEVEPLLALIWEGARRR